MKKKNKLKLMKIGSLIYIFSNIIVLGGCNLVKDEQTPYSNISTIISTSSDAVETITDATIEQQEEYDASLYEKKYKELLTEIYKNGTSDICQFHLVSANQTDEDREVCGITQYETGTANYYYSICDIDGDNREELLIAWSDYYDAYSGGQTYVEILQYDETNDNIKHEAVIPLIKHPTIYYDTSTNYTYGLTVYDNGTILAEALWFNVGIGEYVQQYSYDDTNDIYVKKFDRESKSDFASTDSDVVDLWDKNQFPQLDIYDYETSSYSTIVFPDEYDLDGDGKLYYQFPFNEHMPDMSSGMDLSQWKDINHISDLDIPDDSVNHIVDLSWYSINDYIANGEQNEELPDMDTCYYNLINKYKDECCLSASSQSSSNHFYSTYDLNNDGVMELILGVTDSYESSNASISELRIYTWENNRAYLIVYEYDYMLGSSGKYTIYKSGFRCVAMTGTGSLAYDYYELPAFGTSLKPTESLAYESDSIVTLYYHCDGRYKYQENKTEISEDEYNNIVNSYEEFVPELNVLYIPTF